MRLELQHVSIAIPPGRRNEARAFYGELLGLDERVVPPKLNPEELLWFRVGGDLELHLFDSNEPAPLSCASTPGSRSCDAGSKTPASRRTTPTRSSAGRASSAATRSGTVSS
jgi:hypothetical protein